MGTLYICCVCSVTSQMIMSMNDAIQICDVCIQVETFHTSKSVILTHLFPLYNS